MIKFYSLVNDQIHSQSISLLRELLKRFSIASMSWCSLSPCSSENFPRYFENWPLCLKIKCILLVMRFAPNQKVLLWKYQFFVSNHHKYFFPNTAVTSLQKQFQVQSSFGVIFQKRTNWKLMYEFQARWKRHLQVWLLTCETFELDRYSSHHSYPNIWQRLETNPIYCEVLMVFHKMLFSAANCG